MGLMRQLQSRVNIEKINQWHSVVKKHEKLKKFENQKQIWWSNHVVFKISIFIRNDFLISNINYCVFSSPGTFYKKSSQKSFGFENFVC